MPIEEAEIVSNTRLKNEYWRVTARSPQVCPLVQPGQFVHVRISELPHRVLRRPFSVCDVAPGGLLTIVYKIVGEGTLALSRLTSGALGVMGPLGVPFTVPRADERPVIAAGGYGAAATLLLARRSPSKGVILLGARSAADLILLDEFKQTGFDVRVATQDGSAGKRGLVTDLLAPCLDDAKAGVKTRFYGCGPAGMTLAVARMVLGSGLDAELSVDHAMCCGVGACFACVVKIKDASKEKGWRYARACSEGPVFPASSIHME